MNSTRRRCLALQRKVYRTLRAELDERMGAPPRAIRVYEREYLRDFRPSREKKARAVGKDALLRAIGAAEAVFIGDFHTFSQSPKTALRLMRESGAEGARVKLGLELISSDHQAALDSFQAGKLEVSEFHERIAYAETWGFPWKNYEPVFTWAREHGIRLIALNRPRALKRPVRAAGASNELAELRARDAWAAQIIAREIAASQSADGEGRFFVLYGDLHVGERHLPRELERASKALRGCPARWIAIHQHHDPLYWRMARQGREIETEILRLSSHSYCLFAGTPWARLQSLLNWLESDSGGDAGEDDYLSLIRAYGQAVAELLRIPAPSFESFSVATLEEDDLGTRLAGDVRFSRRERELFRLQVTVEGAAYVPRADFAYLARPTPNRAAEIAAIHLLRRTTGETAVFTGARDDFFRLVLESAFGFLGSLFLNPRRKCDFIGDHRERVGALAAGARPLFRHELEARRLALATLRHHRRRTRRHPVPENLHTVSETRIAWMAAQWTGQVLGKRLHRALLRHAVGTSRVIEIFLTPLEPGESFEDRFFLLRGKASAAPLEQSKSAHI